MDQIIIYILILMAVLTVGGYIYNKNLAFDRYLLSRANQSEPLQLLKGSGWHSQASYHGYYTAWLVGFVSLILFVGGLYFRNGSQAYDLTWLALMLVTGASIVFFLNRMIKPDFAARTWVERFIHACLIVLSVIAVLTTFGIVLSL